MLKQKLMDALKHQNINNVEFFDKCDIFFNILKKWNNTHNLISKNNSDGDIWWRHIGDSCNFIPIIKNIQTSHLRIADIGSGAGFPALILACFFPKYHFTLIEANQKKSAFLRHMALELSLPIEILNQRIEDSDLLKADIITARALADLTQLCAYAQKLSHDKTICLFAKGDKLNDELQYAQQAYHFEYIIHDGQITQQSKIIEITQTTHLC